MCENDILKLLFLWLTNNAYNFIRRGYSSFFFLSWGSLVQVSATLSTVFWMILFIWNANVNFKRQGTSKQRKEVFSDKEDKRQTAGIIVAELTPSHMEWSKHHQRLEKDQPCD